ncbi:hypothetical protein [Pseudooceanicola sp. HF7]|uniref:hypothetical protein n=1 Tax=Pseudooceanicola sp. HF7 TaxID=2721560 RepID=UPI00142F4246|nr:hypothetical protein [Pseudooceanicola sp. HF7]NIZ07947.1 hypothetical protein [Pseudooceanicola sp. HF7]
MTRHARLMLTAAALALPALSAQAQSDTASDSPGCVAQDWSRTMDHAKLAESCLDVAFGDDLKARETLAWYIFAMVNQLIPDPADPETGGMSGSGKVPLWMAWPTDPDTFDTNKAFDFNAAMDDEMNPTAEKKDLAAGRVSTADPDGANEQVTRNKISYDYLIDSGLTTKIDVAEFFKTNDYVEMPVGSIELKASWLQVTDGSPAPEGALTFTFEGGKYWWRGLHLMMKMQTLSTPGDVFYSEEPTWFWSTFEFNDNPGVGHVRDTLITQRAPLSMDEIDTILSDAGIGDFGFENYAPNGTQIRFTVDGTGEVPVILGHTDMEDFAGAPNTAQPRYWTHFEASCHSCHASASYNPDLDLFFPFSVPTGALTPAYNASAKDGVVRYLGQGFKSLDFMWPIAFQAR